MQEKEEIDYAKKLMDEQFKSWMSKVGLSPDISDEDFLEWWRKKIINDK